MPRVISQCRDYGHVTRQTIRALYTRPSQSPTPMVATRSAANSAWRLPCFASASRRARRRRPACTASAPSLAVYTILY
jgi:hypothetical protein